MSKAPQVTVEGPLKGVRILDLTRLYPGPLATMLAAQMGAEVIKIEDPHKPDPMRHYPPFVDGQSAGYLAVNAHKKSLGLKLRSEEGKTLFLDLAKKADVLVEGFRPGVMESAGLGYETLKDVNPRIIYLSITGYGQTGPYANEPGHDLNYIGYAGILGATGNQKTGIIAPGHQPADVAGGAYMALNACLSALYAREKTGVGQYVDVAMLDGVLPLMSLQLAHQWAIEKPPKRGELLLSGGTACYDVYRCACGGYMALGALEPKFWSAFCDMVKRPDWVNRQFDTGQAGEELKRLLQQLFLERSRDEWLSISQGRELCLTPVWELDEVEKDPQLQARGMVVTDRLGRKTLGCPIKFSDTPTGQHSNPAPQPGAHTEDILKELGLSKEQLARLREKGIVKG